MAGMGARICWHTMGLRLRRQVQMLWPPFRPPRLLCSAAGGAPDRVPVRGDVVPLEPEEPSLRREIGVLIRLDADELQRSVLDVEIHAEKGIRRRENFCISMQGVQPNNG